MSSTISSLGGYSSLMTQMLRHNTSKMAQDLFSQIDTSGKGYIEKADLESAFQKLSTSSSSSGRRPTRGCSEDSASTARS